MSHMTLTLLMSFWGAHPKTVYKILVKFEIAHVHMSTNKFELFVCVCVCV